MPYDDWKPGAVVGTLDVPPIDRATLALYAGASGDHNPIHIDLDAARAAGLDDVIAHGMLIMAYLARCLTGAIEQRRVEHYAVRFTAMTRVGEGVRCTVVVRERNGAQAMLTLTAAAPDGEIKLLGEATVRLASDQQGTENNG